VRPLLARRLACILIASLAVALLAPAAASAKAGHPRTQGVRPQYVYSKDAYEPDDSTATARTLPDVSYHTFDTGNDEDWFKITAEETGTPFVLENKFMVLPPYTTGYWDCEIAVYSMDASTGALTPLVQQDDSDVFNYSYGPTVYFTAPAPGTYYVKNWPNSTSESGPYMTYVQKGIARRIAGKDRYETAVEISQRMYPDSPNNAWGSGAGPSAVVLANGAAYADALAAGAWAAQGSPPVPVLLTNRDTVPSVTRDEILRLGTTRGWDSDLLTVYVIGGPSVVSDAQLAELKALQYVGDVVRVSGANRFATAAAVASMTVPSGSPNAPAAGVTTEQFRRDTAFLVNGTAWADALPVGAVASVAHAPVLLSRTGTITAETGAWLLDHPVITRVVVVGSASVVSSDVADALAAPPYSLDVVRVGGVDRYETSLKLAEFGRDEFGMQGRSMLLATGARCPDGLAAAPLAKCMSAPVLLTRPEALSSSVTSYYVESGPMLHASYVLGMPSAVSDTSFRAFRDLWKTPLLP
jgi:putative cell wall-binding protein